LKDRNQEVRKLRADVANANLRADKVTAEKDRFERELAQVKSTDNSRDAEIEQLKSKLVELETTKNDLIRLKEEVDLKESEIEDKSRENEILMVDNVKNLDFQTVSTKY
jgi:hypothetical protein